MATMSSATWAENLKTIKRKKLYLLQAKDWESWCHNNIPFSYKKADRLIEDLDDFGKWGFVAKEALSLSRARLRALDPSFSEDGDIVLAGKKYSLKNEDDITEAQVAIMAIEEERNQAKDRLSDAKKALEEVRGERDEARKDLKKAEGDKEGLKKRIQEAEHPHRYKHADQDQNVIIDLIDRHEGMMHSIKGLHGRELSPDNEARFLGAIQHIAAETIQLVTLVRDARGIGYNQPAPEDQAVVDVMREEARNPRREYLGAFPDEAPEVIADRGLSELQKKK